MKKIIPAIILLINALGAYAAPDTVRVPIQRIYFHDLINKEQVACDKADGKQDGIIKVSANDDINLQVTDALMRKVNDLEDFVETADKIPGNNDKVKYLRFIEDAVRNFRIAWR